MLLALVAAASALDGCSLISSPGAYTLTTDLFGANISVATPYAGSPQFACIAITSSNVVLDCAGFGINGNGTNNTFGVVVQKTDNSSITNVTVKNCDISDYPAADVFAYNMSGGTIANNTLEEGAGAVLYSGSQNSVSGNNATNDTGFLLVSSTDNVLKGNSVTDGFGFMLLKNSDRNTLNGSVVLGNSSGIQLNDSGNATIANTFMGFTGIEGVGIVLSNSSYDKVTNSTLTGEEFWGVLFFGDTVSHNVFSKTNMTGDVPLVFGVNNTDSADVNHFTDNVIGNTTIFANSTLGLIIFSNDTRNNVIADNSLTGQSVEFLGAISNGDFINNTLRNNNVTAGEQEAFEFGALGNAVNNTVLDTRINTNVTFVVAGIAFNNFANNRVDRTVVNTSALAAGIAMIALNGNFTNNSITNTNVTADVTGLSSIPFPFIGAGENLDGNRFINTTFNITNVSIDVLINSTNAMNNQFINTNVNSQHFGAFGTGMGLSVNTSNDFTNNTFSGTTITTDDSDGILFTTLHDFRGNRILNTRLLNMSDSSMIAGLGFMTVNDFNDNNITGTVISANATEGLLIEVQNNSARNILNNTYLPIGFGLGGPALLFVTQSNLTNNTFANTNVSAIDDTGIIIASGNATGNSIMNTRYTASDIGEVFVFVANNDSRGNTIRDTTWNANQTGAFVAVAGNDFIGNTILNTRHNTNSTEEFVIGGLNNTINNTVANTNVTGGLIGQISFGAPVLLGPSVGGDVVNNLFTNTSVSSNLTEFLLFASGNDFVNNTVSNTRFFANMSEGVGVIAMNHSVGNLMANTSVTGGLVGEVIFEAGSDVVSNRIQNTNVDTNLTEAILIGGGNMTNNSVSDTRLRANLSEGIIFMAENYSANNTVSNTNISGNMSMEGLFFQTGIDFVGNRVQNSNLSGNLTGGAFFITGNDFRDNSVQNTNLNANLTQGMFFVAGNDFRNNSVLSTALNANLTEGILFETGNNSASNRIQGTTITANQSEGVVFETTNDFLNNTVSGTRVVSNLGGLVVSEAGNNSLGNTFSGTNVTSNQTGEGLGIISSGTTGNNSVSATTIFANLTDEGFVMSGPNVTGNRIDQTKVTANLTAFGFLLEGNNVSNNLITNTAINSNFSEEGMFIEGDPINSTNNTILNAVNVGGGEAGIVVFSSSSLIDPITTSNGGVGLYVSGNGNRINQLTSFNNSVAGFYDSSQGGNASTISNSLLYNNSWEIIQGSTSGQFVVNNTMLGNGTRQLTISLNDSVDAGYMLNDTGSPGSTPPGVFNSTARFLKVNFTSGGAGETQIDNLTVLNAGTSMFTWNSTNSTPFWVLTPNQGSSGSTVWALSLVNITSDDIYTFGQLSAVTSSGGGPSGGGSSTPSLLISFDQGSGVVTVTSGGSPVPGADVKVDGSGIGTTDQNGQITVPGCGDNVTIDALKSGYTAASTAASLKSCSQPPACTSDQNCSSTQSCVAGACVQVSCPNGTVTNHACVVPQNQTNQTACTAPSCCTSSSQCGDTQACVSPSGAPGSVSSPGSCQQVTGQCGVAANHTFVPYGYECGTEPGCPSCPSGQTCEEHKCVLNDINCPSSVVVGGNATCKATQNNQACGPADNCTATVTTPDGRTLTIPPDDNGNVVVPGSVTGRVKVDLLKDGVVVKEVFIDVVPKSQPTGTSAPAAPSGGPDLSWLWLILLLAIVVGAVVYWRSRGKK